MKLPYCNKFNYNIVVNKTVKSYVFYRVKLANTWSFNMQSKPMEKKSQAYRWVWWYKRPVSVAHLSKEDFSDLLTHKKCNVLFYFEAIYHLVSMGFSPLLCQTLCISLRNETLQVLSECKWSWTRLQAISQAARHNDRKIITFASPSLICCSLALVTAHASALALPLHPFCLSCHDVARLWLCLSGFSVQWARKLLCNVGIQAKLLLAIPRGSSCIMD